MTGPEDILCYLNTLKVKITKLNTNRNQKLKITILRFENKTENTV